MSIAKPATGSSTSRPPSSSGIESVTRWAHPFGVMSNDDVRDVLRREPFRSMCPDPDAARRTAYVSFGIPISIYGVLMNDTRLRRYGKGEIVMRRGDYGNSAYFLLEGALAHVGKPHVDDRLLGRKQRDRAGFLASAVRRVYDLLNPPSPEYRKRPKRQARPDDSGLSVPPAELAAILTPGAYEIGRVHVGEIVGEVGAIYRSPRMQTVIAVEESLVLEIRWQGLRELMEMNAAIARHVHDLYRQHRLDQDLDFSLGPWAAQHDRHFFSELTPEQKRQIQFKVFGKYDEWSSDYLGMEEDARAAVIESEEVIAQDGDYPNGMYIVQAGFARESRRHGHGHQTLNYLTRGQVFGLAELVYNAQNRKRPVPYQHSLRAIGYTHVLFVPTRLVEEFVLPKLSSSESARLLRPLQTKRRSTSGAARAPQVIGADWLEFIVEKRLLNGAKAMLIDLDRCTRCDDCVTACAATHDGNPRFVRHGPIQGHVMVANACMHCADPVCMIGCPTGAIHRESFGGNVVVNEETCIGCGMCATNCPYDAIRMTAVRNARGEFVVASSGEHAGAPVYKATKCDWCVDQPGGPACERACPHDALRRINMQDLDALSKFVRQ